MLGEADVVAKSTRSQNPYNMVRATFDGQSREFSPRQIASRRVKKDADILPAREAEAAPAEAAPAEAG
jgi:small subunit ribosomal protein S5